MPIHLPTALFIGPMKTGTTWIQDYLMSRGDVCLPRAVKETFFFDRYYNRGREWYSHHFNHYDSQVHDQIVEVAPSLFDDAKAPIRAKAILGSVSLIVTTRDPVARSWSHYLHLRRKGYTRLPLRRAVDNYPEILAASRYNVHIERWRAVLPHAEVTVLQLEELSRNPEMYVQDLCHALGLSARSLGPNLSRASNTAGVPPSFLLARFGRQAASALRAAGAYGAVNVAKQMGLKRVFFGATASQDPCLTLSDEDAEWLRKAIECKI